jgi:hypothetical protein
MEAASTHPRDTWPVTAKVPARKRMEFSGTRVMMKTAPRKMTRKTMR